MRITDGDGIDIAFDAIGPTSFRKDYRLLRPGGRLICYGHERGRRPARGATSRRR